jgi:hypothetical protein
MNRILALQRLEAEVAHARVPCFSIYASLVTVGTNTSSL